jgi:membrane protease YdiL (CAAX protease family)
MDKINIKHFAGYVFTMVLFTLVSSYLIIPFNLDLQGSTLVLICLLQSILDILAFYLYTKFVLKEPFKEVFGLYFRKLPKYALLGIIALIAVLATIYLISFIPISNVPVSFQKLYNTNIFTLSCYAVIIAPLREEFLFRGVIQSLLTNKTNPKLGILITSLVFTGSHVVYTTAPIMYVRLLLLGLALSILKNNTKSIIPGYITHLLMNSIILLR